MLNGHVHLLIIYNNFMIKHINQYPFKFHANLDLVHFQLEKVKKEKKSKQQTNKNKTLS